MKNEKTSHITEIQKTKYVYDSFGNVIRKANPLGAETTYTYGWRDTTFTYPDKITNALFQTADYSYALGTGNLQWQKQNDITNYFYYDTFGRIIKEVQPFDSFELPTKNYTYFFDGSSPESIKISQRTSANKTYDTYYYYDGLGNFIQFKKPADSNQQVVKNFFYDGMGRVVSEQNPYFDSFNVSLSTPSTTVAATNYSYDALGRVNSVLNPDGTSKTISFNHYTITAYDENSHRKSYILDSYSRITNVLEYNNDPVLGWNYESDIYNTSYNYDTADNLIKITDAVGNIFSFTYDSLGRRVTLSDLDLGNWTYAYDLAGNLITQVQQGGGNLITGDGYYREYDSLNQLIRIRNGSTATSPIIENYTYDPFGARIKIERNDTAQTKIYTPFKELMRIVNSSGSYDFTYVYQDGTLVARVNPDGTRYYYHSDQLGSTSLITDQNGNVVENTFYSPFGEILGGGSVDTKLYTGQFADKVLCQYYYGKRYFSPCLGMFTQADTLVKNLYNPQNLNSYSYVLNNPYAYTDPTGRYEKDVHYDLTYYLALQAGYDKDEAEQIAQADYFVDRDYRLDYVSHFQSTETARQNSIIMSSDLNEFGKDLHTYQDSYAHKDFVRQVPSSPNKDTDILLYVATYSESYSAHSYETKRGTNPDKTYNDVGKANSMARGTYDLLVQKKEQVCRSTDSDWEKIQATVNGFDAEKSYQAKITTLGVSHPSEIGDKVVWWNPFTWTNGLLDW